MSSPDLIYLQSIKYNLERYYNSILESDDENDRNNYLKWYYNLVDEIITYSPRHLTKAGLQVDEIIAQKNTITEKYGLPTEAKSE